MFGRKKNEETLQQQLEEQVIRPGAKNRPTPKRRVAQAARQRPLVPADRKVAAAAAKEAAKEAKQQARLERAQRQDAMRRGEEWALLARDRGPERAFARDVVDVRWNVGELLLPIMLIGLPMTLFPLSTIIARVGFAVVYGLFAMFLIDTLLVWLRLRRLHLAKFGRKPARGTFFYIMSRSLSIRRTRMPLPRVKRGETLS